MSAEQQPARRRRQRIHGVLLLDKPLEISSNGALGAAKRLFNADKAGHTGTLDPLASGLLPVLFGDATKFSADLLDADKTYQATLKLGEQTTTGDREGDVIATAPVVLSEDQVRAAVQACLGEQDQMPPMYSALKHQGRPLYEYARQGIEIARASRRIVIHAITLARFEPPFIDIVVTCSKGTYIRTLAEDLGTTLGCGAHLQALRRTAVGSLGLTDALTLEQVGAVAEDARLDLLMPVDGLLRTLPEVVLDASQSLRFAQGQRLPLGPQADQGRCRVYGDGHRFLGMAVLDPHGLLKPERLVQQA